MFIHFFSLVEVFIRLFLPLNDGSIDQEILQKLIDHSWTHPPEKVYLHTDRSLYFPGDDIWFKAYLMLGPYQIPDTMTSVLYVELINNNGTIINRRPVRIREGLGWGDFQIPVNIIPGDYILKAYTNYMRNYDPDFHFRKPISIVFDHSDLTPDEEDRNPDKLKKKERATAKPVQLQFFPEGGNLVEGLNSDIAFKSTDQNGLGKNVKGKIMNSSGAEITSFESRKFGLGYFSFKPEKEEIYSANINIDGKEYSYELPNPLKQGYVMHINPKGDQIYIWVKCSPELTMNNSFIIGQFRGYPFITIHAEPEENFIYSVISVKDIPSGIIQFTFFDSLGIPQCERLVYAENEQNQMQIDIVTNKKTYRKREKIDFNIHCEDTLGNTPLTNLSLSIINSNIIRKDDKKSNIKSYFDLESDLRGYIENPGYYFNPQNEDRYELLDILLLTHGWRRFVWKNILEKQKFERQFQAEMGFTIEGELDRFRENSDDWVGYVGLYIFEGQFYYNEIETDKNGRFHFYGINIYDSTDVILQAWKENKSDKKSKRKKIPLKIYSHPFPEVEPDLWPLKVKDEEEEVTDDYFDLNELILRLDSSYGQRTIVMEELVIEDEKIDPEELFERPGKLHKQATRRIVLDSLDVSEQSLLLFDLIRNKFPGISYRGTPPDIQVSIRGRRALSGGDQALLILDGIQVTSDVLYYFPVTEVEFIDILSQNRAAIYGSGAMGGAITVFTRQGRPVQYIEQKDLVLNFVYPGYYRAREFYAPNYGIPEEKHLKPDFRKILYWNPSLTTNEGGDIEFSFYSSDEVAEYRVEIEGMTYDGVPVVEEYYFSVE
jgi:hypothetical protein